MKTPKWLWFFYLKSWSNINKSVLFPQKSSSERKVIYRKIPPKLLTHSEYYEHSGFNIIYGKEKAHNQLSYTHMGPESNTHE